MIRAAERARPSAVLAALAVLTAAATGCHAGANEPPPTSPIAAGTGTGTATSTAVTLAPGPGTAVVALDAGVATPILVGPFAVTAINPGTDLELALTDGPTCPAVGAWFAYSGGGVAVGRGQTLCARTHAARTHGFSGHD